MQWIVNISSAFHLFHHSHIVRSYSCNYHNDILTSFAYNPFFPSFTSFHNSFWKQYLINFDTISILFTNQVINIIHIERYFQFLFYITVLSFSPNFLIQDSCDHLLSCCFTVMIMRCEGLVLLYFFLRIYSGKQSRNSINQQV